MFVIKYTSPPTDREAWEEISMEELTGLLDEFRSAETQESARQTEWSQKALDVDIKGAEIALKAAKQGKIVLTAQDEDGYYFAIL